jgi:multidrug resistance efflux pump
MKPTTPIKTNPRHRSWYQTFALFALLVLSTCQSTGPVTNSNGIVVVNAPAAGEVRRILVSEGVAVNEGAAILEIAVRTEMQTAPQNQTDNPKSRAVKNIDSAQSEVETARAEVVRTEIEVERLTPLVASGDAPQAQLDGARADYDRAQQRLRKGEASAQDAQAGLIAARQPSNTPSPTTPSEQIVTARATSAGIVTAVSVQVGARVTTGQPVVTLRVK